MKVRIPSKYNYFNFVTISSLLYLSFSILVFLSLSNGSVIDNIINGKFQISDSGDHYDCIDNYARFILSIFSQEVNAWCLRRPTYQILMVPLFLISSGKINIIIILNIILSLFVFYFISKTLYRFNLPLGFIILFLTIWTYASNRLLYSLGPEFLSFIFSSISIIFLLKALNYNQIRSLFASFFWTILAFETRPGNPIFVLFFLFFTLFAIFHLAKSKKLNSYIYLIPFVILVVTVFIPRAILKGLGLKNSYHGGNFWGPIYSLVNPDAQTWAAAYEDFGNHPDVLNEINLWEMTRARSIEIFFQDWSPAKIRFLDNVEFFIYQTPLKLSLNLFSVLDLHQTIYDNAFLFLTLNAIVIVLYIVFRIFQYKKIYIFFTNDKIFTILINTLITYYIIFALLATASNYPYFLSHLKSGNGTLGIQLNSMTVLLTATLVIGLLQVIFLGFLNKFSLLFFISFVNVFSAAIFFGLIGHDEPNRHQIQNIPYYIFLLLPLFSLNLKDRARVNRYSFEIKKLKYFNLGSFIFLLILVTLGTLTLTSDKIEMNQNNFSCTGQSRTFKIIEKVINPFTEGQVDSFLIIPLNNWLSGILQNSDWKYYYLLRGLDLSYQKSYIIKAVSNNNYEYGSIHSLCIENFDNDIVLQLGIYSSIQ